jgi:hypothetical protein
MSRWREMGAAEVGADCSGRVAVAEVYDAAGEPALVNQLELGARVPRQRRLASTDDYGTDEQVAFID